MNELENDKILESEWVIDDCDDYEAYCKHCGQRALYDDIGNLITSDFCPRCGARMIGNET